MPLKCVCGQRVPWLVALAQPITSKTAAGKLPLHLSLANSWQPSRKIPAIMPHSWNSCVLLAAGYCPHSPKSTVARTHPTPCDTWAISILLDYAADRPEFLADLLMDGDAVQFAKLLPRLEAQPAKAVAVLQAELDREPRPEAWPKSTTDPIWQKPADSVIHQLEAANGLCQEHFALCQTLPLAKFAALAEGATSLWLPAGARAAVCRRHKRPA